MHEPLQARCHDEWTREPFVSATSVRRGYNIPVRDHRPPRQAHKHLIYGRGHIFCDARGLFFASTISQSRGLGRHALNRHTSLYDSGCVCIRWPRGSIRYNIRLFYGELTCLCKRNG